ncbi:DUF1802 family protein [Paenibacillus athensensis]|uniref:DUF1802 family protein n=1 Tax=Paenibacillus athensensis TaxID=1967502 RepID=A0A4Y8PWR1_9BACL|nr:DUF1802 family protein [Paenibacillus athensensis]MCD1258823.1 DUF1802 family protein [Paenibacillus athensensis]
MERKPIALKEWAAAIRALESGAQMFIMRKGGIIEETRDFQVQAEAFYLYPTYEHQRRELLKEAYRPVIDQTLEGWTLDAATAAITCYAELVEDILIEDQERLGRLFPYHIWTENFAEERLRWKRKNPLHVLLLRVYKLDEPQEVPIDPAYLGCKSWIELTQPLGATDMKPVLSDAEFAERVAAIRAALA